MNIQKKLDYPYWSKVALDATGSKQLFTTGAGTLSAVTNMPFAGQLDKSAIVTMFLFQVSLLKTANTAWVTADMDLISRAIRNSFINFQKNGGERVVQYSLSSFLSVPATFTADGYDVSRSVTGQKNLNIAALIPGGQQIEASISWTNGVDLSGLDFEAVIWGPTDRTQATGVQA